MKTNGFPRDCGSLQERCEPSGASGIVTQQQFAPLLCVSSSQMCVLSGVEKRLLELTLPNLKNTQFAIHYLPIQPSVVFYFLSPQISTSVPRGSTTAGRTPCASTPPAPSCASATPATSGSTTIPAQVNPNPNPGPSDGPGKAATRSRVGPASRSSTKKRIIRLMDDGCDGRL